MNSPLVTALAAEDAAIYAYGPIGVRLIATTERVEARSAEAVHRSRRDTLITRLHDLRASAEAPSAGYVLPFPVTDRSRALRLAADVEDAVAAAWRSALPATEQGDRATAVSALIDAAVRATRWRRLAGASPLTMPFPGRVG